ncbi:hypothetical protein EIB18_12980 [Caulobacter vibrioides]|uniref:Uncharacterized protein n=1 Tax=Caulobacter vibrioides (strain NA1000 / CB15N) TaxID=565050 RepID=A0A0H3CCD0_CAUVN|nr:hypothetical protein [Caulobacter vibrioides]YP_002517906.1 hypothetical protein CCNA_02533 [Caulobacter vibrioides NA1000]ACL95998.1 hypothetical protein CCNA_02533 [Caulobacter vibrioides NA1000]ATC29303.1 hypothetical protein CA607_13275 [Caulobacter vibrioides]AZH13532.1 hypothetical protein EIB18_12980 [Caulobacter vibrioides]QXZ50815.1 hypothetical protein KZH45_13035 [Caulobacter vibrioides]
MIWMQAAVIAAFSYMGSVFALWRRSGQLHAEGASSLPKGMQFLTGGIVFWIWSDGHQAANDTRLSKTVWAARAFFVAFILLFGVSIVAP